MVHNIQSKPSVSVISIFLLAMFMVFKCSPVYAVFALPTAHFLTEEEREFIRDNPVLKYAPDRFFAPFEFVEDGLVKGIVPEYLESISKKTGLKFEPIVYTRWSEAYDELVKGEIDIIMATPSESRLQFMNFTDTILNAQSAIVVREESADYLTMEDLKTWRIGAVEGYITIDELLDKYPNYQISTYPDVDSAMRATSFGEVDAFIINVGSASYSIEKNKFLNLKVAGEAPFSSELAFATKKDSEILVSILNKTLAQLPQSEKERIESSWIKLSMKSLWTNPVVWQVGLVVVLIGIALWAWIVLLRIEVNRRTKELQLSKDALNQIIDHVPHLIFVKDYEGHYLIANAAAADFYNCRIQDVLGKTHGELMGDYSPLATDRHQAIVKRDRGIIDTQASITIEYETSVDARGVERIFSVYKRSIFLYNQPKLCALTVAVDITAEFRSKEALKAQEQALRQAEHQMADLEKKATLGSMVAGITHEINNPIGISVTALSHLIAEFEEFKGVIANQRLTRDILSQYLDVNQEALDILKSNINRAVDMVSSFKRMSVDQLSEAQTTFDLCETISHVIHSLTHEFRKKGHRIDYHCSGPLMLTSYPGSYSQVLTNLMMNSLIHGFEHTSNGLVTIQVTHTDSDVTIHYQDNGIGMTPDTLEKVWQPYFTTKRDSGGSGLGMQIIYNIVVRTLQGTIKFTSAPNHGVSCLMQLPINRE